jgi:hypothetical protein
VAVTCRHGSEPGLLDGVIVVDAIC